MRASGVRMAAEWANLIEKRHSQKSWRELDDPGNRTIRLSRISTSRLRSPRFAKNTASNTIGVDVHLLDSKPLLPLPSISLQCLGLGREGSQKFHSEISVAVLLGYRVRPLQTAQRACRSEMRRNQARQYNQLVMSNEAWSFVVTRGRGATMSPRSRREPRAAAYRTFPSLPVRPRWCGE